MKKRKTDYLLAGRPSATKASKLLIPEHETRLLQGEKREKGERKKKEKAKQRKEKLKKKERVEMNEDGELGEREV